MNFGAVVGGVAAMLLIDGFSLQCLRRMNPIKLRSHLAAFPALVTAKSRVDFVLANLSGVTWEELVFRYLPFVLFGQNTPILASALVISSVLFGLQHVSMGWRQVVYCCVLGCLFSALVWASGSIWASLSAHFVGNFFTVVVARPVLVRSLNVYRPPF